MSRKRPLRIASTGAVGLLALVIISLLPGVALAEHDDEAYDGCYETSTADVDGGDESVSSDGGVDTPTTEPIYVCSGEGEAAGGGGWAGGLPPHYPFVADGKEGGGTAADGGTRTLAAAGPGCAAGGSAGAGGGAGFLQPDSDTADIGIDSSAADLDEEPFAASGMAAGTQPGQAAVSGCVREVALIGGDGVVAPTRIDAGAGGAAAGVNGPAMGLAVTTLFGAACEVVRRRRR